MIFSNEQFDTLSQWERNFNEVLDQRVCRNVGDRATQTIAQIWHSVKNTPVRRYTCSQCRYNLLRQVATAYRADKAERMAIDAEKTEQKPSESKKASKVSTRKRKAKE